MITADKLNLLTSLNTNLLASVLSASGYKDCKFKTAQFLGLTNGNQFCYSVSFVEDGADQTGKVFVSYDKAEDKLTADF